MTEARTLSAQRALDLYNMVQLCHEMHWTEAELYATSDDFAWAALQILDLEGQKAKRESEDQQRGRGSPSASTYRNDRSVQHHRASAPPERVP